MIEFERAHRQLSVTPHVYYELYRGVSSARAPGKELRWIDELGARFRLLPFDREAAKLAARMGGALQRDGLSVPERDLFIAATAIVWGDGEIITRDVGHFRRLRAFGLRVHPA